jgi:hypothetical protein
MSRRQSFIDPRPAAARVVTVTRVSTGAVTTEPAKAYDAFASKKFEARLLAGKNPDPAADKVEDDGMSRIVFVGFRGGGGEYRKIGVEDGACALAEGEFFA